jgi:UDP:flavonoid glycosyltransferase YjiC (YdhE family)
MAKKPVILFAINGLGMGNSTRCHVVIQRLAAEAEVHVITSGNGLFFLADRPEITTLAETPPLAYAFSGDGVNALGTLSDIRTLRRTLLEKKVRLEKRLDRLKPDLVVTDSEYVIRPVLNRKIPLAGINNSDVVVSRYFRHKKLPPSIRPHFWGIEYSDYLLHRMKWRMAVSPSPFAGTPRSSVFKRTGLIVRDGARETAKERAGKPAPLPQETDRIVVMLSGSAFASQIDALQTLPWKVDVIGRDGVSGGNVTYHGKIRESLDFVRNAGALVINGGFSSVSEAVAMMRPVYVIPVPNHAEQLINALMVKEIGAGDLESTGTIIQRLKEAHRLNRWDGINTLRTPVNFNGGDEAAELLLGLLCDRSLKF